MTEDATLGIAEFGFLRGGTEEVLIAEAIEITPPQRSVNKVKVSNHDSPDKMQEYIPGWIDYTDGSGTFIYEATRYGLVHDLVDAREVITYFVRLKETSDVWQWEGFIGTDNPELPMEDKATFKLTLIVARGGVVHTPGTP